MKSGTAFLLEDLARDMPHKSPSQQIETLREVNAILTRYVDTPKAKALAAADGMEVQ